MINPKKKELIYKYQVNKRFGNTTFESFIRYVIQDNKDMPNDHWRPYWNHVGCANPLDYYIKDFYNFKFIIKHFFPSR